MSKMEFAKLFLQILAGNPLLDAFLNAVDLAGIGAKAMSKFKGDKTPEEVFWTLFLKVGYETLVDAAKDMQLLDAICIKTHKNEIYSEEISLKIKDLNNVVRCIPHSHEKVICNYFDFFYEEVRRGLKDSNSKILDAEKVDELINSARVKMWDKWVKGLRVACKQYPKFGRYVVENDIDPQALLSSGIDIPKPACGADAHYFPNLRLDEQLPYLEQYILISNEKTPLSARPIKQPEDWWSYLSGQLEKAPLFLTGPGGMGKTTFLKFLYNSIRIPEMKLPFSCAFLLSLDTLILQKDTGINWDIPALDVASESILFQRIALLSNQKQQVGGWKSVFDHSFRFSPDSPVLLLLDGFNEMRGRRRERLYHRILQEIRALSDLQSFSNLRIIVTSRVDRENLLEDQMKELPGFQHAELCGICLPFEAEAVIQKYETRQQEIRSLLERPMYYLAVFGANGEFPHFSTQFELIEIMYKRLCQQGIANLGDELAPEPYQYLMDYLMPIIAYNVWNGQKRLKESVDQLKSWIPMIAANSGIYPEEIEYQLNDVLQTPNAAIKYLLETVQVLYHQEGQFYFRHQDYRDYLVAKYFLQRLDYIRHAPYADQWTQKSVLDSLSPNTYSTDIMRLIYQAVSFSDSKEPKEYIERFQLENWAFTFDAIPPGYILWYTTAYQLCDMRGLEGVEYAGEDLNRDTLKIMKPLLECVEREFRPQRPPDLLLPSFIETLMKCCELYRSTKDYHQARNVIQAARYFLETDTEIAAMMRNTVDYNDFKLDMAEFLNGNQEIGLNDALEKLRHSACQGTPFRYACNTLGMLLVSPHPALKERPEFNRFRENVLCGQAPEVRAFWLHYAAVFDPRKEGEDWLPRMYSLRQMLYLLAENKVAITNVSLDVLKNIDLRMLKKWCGGHIVIPDTDRSIPGPENLVLVKRFLDEIEGVPEEKKRWTYYLQALVVWQLNEDDIHQNSIGKALCILEKADQKDVRTQLLSAALQGRGQELFTIYENYQPQGGNMPIDIGGYSVKTYYSRDIARIRNTLREIP